MMRRLLRHGGVTRAVLLMMVAATLSSCSIGKYVQPGQKMLYRNNVTAVMTDGSEAGNEVEDIISNTQRYYIQKPNKGVLFFRPWMWFYCLSNPNDSSWVNRFIRQKGEAPVIYSAAAAGQTADQLRKLMNTKGCFNSTVDVETEDYGHNSVVVNYKIHATNRRKIDEVVFSCRQSAEIDSMLQAWKGESLLKVDDYYDQDKMTQEQNRIASKLNDEGYFFASSNLVRFIVDTNYDNQVLSIRVVVRTPRRMGADTVVANNALQKYHIDNIYIYPNITNDIAGGSRHLDTLVYPYENRGGITYYQFIHDKKIAPSPRAISRALYIYSGQTYRPRIVTSTSSSLLGLKNFKYVDISFDESPNSTDTNRLLDARIRLLNSTRHRLSLSLELTNASDIGQQGSNLLKSGNLGFGTTAGYQNNSLFGGAEVLNLEGNLLIDMPKNVFGSNDNSSSSNFSAKEYGLTATLDLPSFLLPMTGGLRWQSNRPHTLIGTNVSYIYRTLSIPDSVTSAMTDVLLEQIRFGGSFGYTWSHRRVHQHKLLPLNLSYSHIRSGEEYYLYLDKLTKDNRFAYQAIDYVLLNTHYEYTYTNQIIGTRNNFNYLHLSVETAGNVLGVVGDLLGWAKQNSDDQDLLFYQYFRLESEFKRYIHWGKSNTLVLRALLGMGLPYGHSSSLPYEKMFVGGGPTTMRGWALRRLGYGQFLSSESDYALGIGDIQFVANVEQRFPLFSIFEGAVFVDAGNVWSCSDWGIGGGNKFVPAEIAEGVALDAGIALRANVYITVLRLDVALPIYDPGYRPGQRWIDSHWSWNKIAFNIGINYPF